MNQIPRFIPGTTSVQEYTAKLRFLASMWPSTHLDQLAPGAALMVEGTAFRKVARIPPSKLKVNSTDGVAAWWRPLVDPGDLRSLRSGMGTSGGTLWDQGDQIGKGAGLCTPSTKSLEL